MPGMSKTKFCPKHKNNQTNLKCGKCEELICPQCMVQTLVGARCHGCAQIKRLPTFDVSGLSLARSIVVGIVLGLVGGLGIGFLTWRIGGFLVVFAIVGLGYVIGEGISHAANRKRGRILKYVAAGSMVVALGVISMFTPAIYSLYGILGAFIAIYIAMNRF